MVRSSEKRNFSREKNKFSGEKTNFSKEKMIFSPMKKAVSIGFTILPTAEKAKNAHINRD